MTNLSDQQYANEYFNFLANKEFPCVAARAALTREHIRVFVAGHMACPKDDKAILDFMYSFVDEYRNTESFFHSAAIIFKGPEETNEEMFDQFLWMRLQALAGLDAQQYGYDKRVSSNPTEKNFSFSLKEEAFYVIGLHPQSSRKARQFKYPAFVFNPHQQFEELRKTNSYEKMKNIVRKRDIAYSGSVNPMLKDFGQFSEVFQYSGKQHDESWQCPFKTMHNQPGTIHEHHTTP
ncbi:MAG: guanitoxin biosynthesis heme-dependent pre-guanitoxin N-hydroxylase GntA [Ferruginibacter sp.]